MSVASFGEGGAANGIAGESKKIQAPFWDNPCSETQLQVAWHFSEAVGSFFFRQGVLLS